MKLKDLQERNILPIRSEIDRVSDDLYFNIQNVHIALTKIIPKLNVLGQGNYGITVNLPGNKWVCKIWVDDAGYAEFVHFCSKNKNPHLPIFRDYRELKQIRKQPIIQTISENFTGEIRYKSKVYYYVIIEKLNPISEREFNSKFLAYRAWLCHIDFIYQHQMDNVITSLKSDPRTTKLTRMLYRDNFKQFSKLWPEIEQSLGGLPDSWKKITTKLKKFKKDHFQVDLHHENVMVRNGDTLVITDPFIED